MKPSDSFRLVADPRRWDGVDRGPMPPLRLRSIPGSAGLPARLPAGDCRYALLTGDGIGVCVDACMIGSPMADMLSG